MTMNPQKCMLKTSEAASLVSAKLSLAVNILFFVPRFHKVSTVLHSYISKYDSSHAVFNFYITSFSECHVDGAIVPHTNGAKSI